jgi:FKBP-type peptidyl-prolyl cis-trans isomerase FkpA
MRAFVLFVLVIILNSCSEPASAPKKQKLSKEQMERLSVEMNAWDRRRQNDEIEQYVKNKGWTMEMTASGLRYMKLKEGKGDLAVAGQWAKVSYTITLLDGTICYSSEQDGAKEVMIGKDNIESGLHEALQLMRIGDKMRFILPSHLAHGLIGDQTKIPPRASVIYEIELLELR